MIQKFEKFLMGWFIIITFTLINFSKRDNNITMKKYSLSFLLLIFGISISAQKSIDQKVTELLSKMTLEEKAGQLVQYSGFEYATGPQNSNSKKVLDEIKSGKVGSMLNVTGAEETKAFQKLALESRLKIPLIFGQDVIHGFRTTFQLILVRPQAGIWK